jgi:hypothetical protein
MLRKGQVAVPVVALPTKSSFHHLDHFAIRFNSYELLFISPLENGRDPDQQLES